MFLIEIMRDESCPMKCGTCPNSIQSLTGSNGHLIKKAYTSLQEKLGTTPFIASFTDDLLKLPNLIKEFNVTRASLVSANMNPLHIKGYSDVISSFGNQFPNSQLTIGFLNKQNTLNDSAASNIIKLAQSFFDTRVKDFQISIGSNAVTHDQFQEQIIDIITKDNLLEQAFAETFTSDNHSMSKELDIRKERNFGFLKSKLEIKKGAQSFYLSRRIMTQRDHASLSKLDYYKQNAREICSMITRKELDCTAITLVPMGVRISHAPYDIQNPYLWITYHEFFYYLENSPNMLSFCVRLSSLIQLTIHLKTIPEYFEITDEKSINDIAEMRKLKLS